MIWSFSRGTIIRTRITCKKIPYCMRESACREFIVKKAKNFEFMLNIFEFSKVWENVEPWLVYANKLFLIAQPYFLINIIKRNLRRLLFLAFKTFNEKSKASYSVTVLTVTVSLYFNKTNKKIKLFYLHCSYKTLLSNQVGRI